MLVAQEVGAEIHLPRSSLSPAAISPSPLAVGPSKDGRKPPQSFRANPAIEGSSEAAGIVILKDGQARINRFRRSDRRARSQRDRQEKANMPRRRRGLDGRRAMRGCTARF